MMKKSPLVKIQTVSIVSVLCTVLAFSFFTNAQAFHEEKNSVIKAHERHHIGKNRMKMMTIALDLTPSQQAEITKIKVQAKEKHKENRTILKQFKTQAKVLVQAANFDEHAFSALQSRYQSHFEQAVLQRAKTRHAIFNVLNAQQQAKWQKMRQARPASLGSVDHSS